MSFPHAPPPPPPPGGKHGHAGGRQSCDGALAAPPPPPPSPFAISTPPPPPGPPQQQRPPPPPSYPSIQQLGAQVGQMSFASGAPPMPAATSVPPMAEQMQRGGAVFSGSPLQRGGVVGGAPPPPHAAALAPNPPLPPPLPPGAARFRAPQVGAAPPSYHVQPPQPPPPPAGARAGIPFPQRPPPPPPQQQQQSLHQRPLPQPVSRNSQQQQQQQQQGPGVTGGMRPHQQERINPRQIPRVPCFTRPDGAPARIYYPKRALLGEGARRYAADGYDGGYGGINPTGYGSGFSSSQAVGGRVEAQGFDPALQAPPQADSRYLVIDDGNASPRLIRSTCFAFPRTKGIADKVGLPLGLVCNPLGVGSEGFVARVVDGRAPPAGDGSETAALATAAHYDSDQTESTPLISSPFPGGGPVRPHRCPRCFAYLNPFSINPHLHSGGMVRGSSLTFDCNFCGHSARVEAVTDVNDPAYSLGLIDSATKFGTVEYELGGDVSPEYVTRRKGEGGSVKQVVLFAVDANPDVEMGSMVEYYLDTIMRVAREMGDWWSRQGHEMKRGPASTGNVSEDRKCDDDDQRYGDNSGGTSAPRVGFFLFRSDRIAVPHYRTKFSCRSDCAGPLVRDGVSGEIASKQLHSREGETEEKLAVAIMADVTSDPFSPLPSLEFTFDVTDLEDMQRLATIIDTVPKIMKECFVDDETASDPQTARYCGGAALAVLASALSSTGGRGVLLTSHRSNYGLGSLRDRESGGPHYTRTESERELYTPLQHLVKPKITFSNKGSDVAAAKFYSELAEKSARDRVSLDVVATTPLLEYGVVGAAGTGMPRPRFLDIATISELCRATCGKLHLITFDESDREGYCTSLGDELVRSMTSFAGYDAVFKLRCSSGVEVESFSPKMRQSGVLVDDSVLSSPELEMGTVTPDTCVAVRLRHKIGGIPKDKGSSSVRDPVVYFQTALLYTTQGGRRQVRVTTLALRTTSVTSEVFRLSDFGAITAFMTRDALSDLLRPDGSGTPAAAREAIVERCVNILANYRLHTSAKTSPSGQLILPETLQLLPLFCLSLRKSPIFRPPLTKGFVAGRPSPTADERAYYILCGANISASLAMLTVHSNLYVLSKLRKMDGLWITPSPLPSNACCNIGTDQKSIDLASCRPYIQLPKSAHPSIASIDDGGVYLLDDGFVFHLYLGRAVPASLLNDLISFDPASQAPKLSSSSESGQKVKGILWQLRNFSCLGGAAAPALRPTSPSLVIVLANRSHQDGHRLQATYSDDAKHSFLENRFVARLVDDSTSHESDYSDFLCDLHRKIQIIIDG